MFPKWSPPTVAPNPYMRVPETPPVASPQIARAGFSFLRMTPREGARNTIETVFLPSTKPHSVFGFERSFSAGDQWATGGREGSSNEKMRPMSRKTRIRRPLPNSWDGRWWIHVRYCSTHCEALHELERRERQTSLYTPSSLAAVRRADCRDAANGHPKTWPI
jgi:hypothetical protein